MLHVPSSAPDPVPLHADGLAVHTLKEENLRMLRCAGSKEACEILAEDLQPGAQRLTPFRNKIVATLDEAGVPLRMSAPPSTDEKAEDPSYAVKEDAEEYDPQKSTCIFHSISVLFPCHRNAS